jgi:protein-L-isoaspartate(D-aspartate) O-methyltransferase
MYSRHAGYSRSTGLHDRRLAFCKPLPHNAYRRMGNQRMFDAAKARRLMVEGQIRTADVTDTAVLHAMQTLPRERFLPPALAQLAYLDGDVPVRRGRTLLRPMVLAKLVQAARISLEDRVLVVGCATGYSAALISRLAASVVALEEDAELAGQARETLASVGAANVEVVGGPLAAGWPAGAPYDVIFLDGATEVPPDSLGGQLKPDGSVVGVYRPTAASKATVFHFVEGHMVGRPAFDAAARVLPGFSAPPQFVF